MEVIKHTLNEQINIPNILKNQITDKKICFMDIETTGFSRKYNQIILIGMLYSNNSKTEIVQLFSSSEKDEKELLCKFKDLISDFEFIVTFNGDAFDIPFINSRFSHHNIDYQIDKDKSIDILKVIRKNKNILDLEKYNLKSIERFLGIEREDKISGKESIEMYFEYTKTKNNDTKDIILMHNYEDIYNLPKIMKIFDVIDVKSRINFKSMYLNHNIDIAIEVDSAEYNGNMMFLEGSTNILNLSEEIHYGNDYVFKWYPQIGKFQISFQTENGKLSDGSKCLYIDSNTFKSNIGEINKLNYTLPDNIIMLNHNNCMVKDNIELFIKYLWEELNNNKLGLGFEERETNEDS